MTSDSVTEPTTEYIEGQQLRSLEYMIQGWLSTAS